MLVAAVASNGAIGIDGELPWHIPADLARFRSITMGKPIVMGRATFESIGRPLPGRLNIVLTRQEEWQAEGTIAARTTQEAIKLARHHHPDSDICIIGGGQVYELFMPLASRLEITAVDAAPDGDAHFPEWDRSNWQLVAEEARQGPPPYSFQTWLRESGQRDS